MRPRPPRVVERIFKFVGRRLVEDLEQNRCLSKVLLSLGCARARRIREFLGEVGVECLDWMAMGLRRGRHFQKQQLR